MKNNIIKILFTIVAIMSLLCVSAFAAGITDEQTDVIKLLEIANGDAEGNMNFDNNVTRAEFVKMAVSTSKDKELASNIKLNISLFPDVKNSHWSAGYVSVAINNGLVNGYIDGTFKPNNNVTLEEAATIVLRLLGYSDSDYVGSYPYAQLQKYKDLDLDKGIGAVKGDKLTREECMILLYNALSAKTKSGSVYCTTLGHSVNSDGKIDYSALLEDKLDGPYIVDDANDIFAGTAFVEDDETSFVLNNVPSSRGEIKENDVIYYSDVINTVFAYRKTATGIITSSNTSTVTLGNKVYSIATAQAQGKLSLGGAFSESKSFATLILGFNDEVVDIVSGSIDKISDNEDNASQISMIDATTSKPIYIKDSSMASEWQSLIPFDVSSADIYIEGSKTASPYIKANDVIYYSKQFNAVWVYKSTKSGAIEAITPANAPTSVTVSGKTYSVVTSEAQYDLSIYGPYEVGDRVTIILGKDNECVAVENAANTSGIIYGVVTGLGEKTYVDKDGDSYTADYVTVTDTSASTHTYEHKKSSLSVGDAVKVVVGEKVTVSKLSTDIGKSAVNSIIDALEKGNFADNCEIIDTKDSDVLKILPERLSGTTLDRDYFNYYTVVLFYEFDDNGNISKLILKDFTGDLDEYGVVTSSEKGTVKYLVDNIERNISSDLKCSSGAARLVKEGTSIVSVSSLTGYIENVTLTNHAVYDENDKGYLVSDDLKVFIKNVASYEYCDIEDVQGSDYKLTAYYDKAQQYGGRIRVIIATKIA